MRVKWKTPLIIIPIITLLVFFSGCTVYFKSSISGKLTLIYSGSQSGQALDLRDISLEEFYGQQSKAHVQIPEDMDFVPDEIIVKYKPGVDPFYMTKSTKGSSFSTLKGDNNIGKGAVQLLKLELAVKSTYPADKIKELTLNEINWLNSLHYVEYAEPNYIYRALSEPNDEYYNKYRYQWHYLLINLDKFWSDGSLDSVQDFSNMRVAVIDSGIARKHNGTDWDNHPDLDGIFSDEYDFVYNDPDARDTTPVGLYHGTHVIGTIGALTNNSSGVAGVAGGNGLPGDTLTFKGVRIIPIRALDGQIGYASDIAQAILYAAGLGKEYSLPEIQKADIINMSFGGASSNYVKEAIEKAYTQKVILVASAGNESANTSLYPAAYPEVISVSAVDIGAQLADYSNYGTTIDIAAPGGNNDFDLNFDSLPDGVFSTNFYNDQFGYTAFAGTSMATPHVTGVAAIVIRALQENPNKPDITPQAVKNILTSTAIYIGNSEYYGAGLVNVHAAASKALGQTTPQIPVMFPFPKTVKLMGLTSFGSFNLKNIGKSDPITVDTIKILPEYDPENLISGISPQSGIIDSDGLYVQVTFNTNGKKNGKTYSAMIEVTNSEGNKEHVYAVYKYVGKIYVVAFDASSYEIVQVTTTTYENEFEYTFIDIPSGSYIIGASTDRDNDNCIFEQGEVYGYFQSTSNLVTIQLDSGQSLNDVDFQIIDELL